MQLLLFITICSLCGISLQASINDKLYNSEVIRSIDISSQVVKSNAVVSLENGGETSAKSFHIPIDAVLSNHLAYISASVEAGGEKSKTLVVKEVQIKEIDAKVFEISLDGPLASGQTVKVTIDMVFSHTLRAFPEKIAQAEKQNVVFEGNHYFFSPYKTGKQTTTVKLASSTVESYSKLKPTSQEEETITYGPYENIAPLQKSSMKIHYENNSPFLTVVNMVRTIEVSHWGNVAVEETFHIRHTGAELKGTFSRYDYQRSQTYAVIKSFKSVLPASAADVYYRDEIGNISTSNLLALDDSVELEIRPRFPLFGGWQTRYYIGYNVPSYEYLFSQGNNYQLRMRFVDHIFDDFVVDHFTLRIILPEGSKDLNMELPFDATPGQTELHYTYLDTFGRPVVMYHKNNLVEQHIQEFELQYRFNKILLLQEPLLLVGALYLMFLAVIVYVRMDFSITKDAVQEARLRAAGLVEELIGLLEQRRRLYESYVDAMTKYKSSKDSGAFMTTRKKIDDEYRSVSSRIAERQAALAKDQAESGDKMVDLQRKEKDLKVLMNEAIQFAQKVVDGKINKQAYIEADQANATKREKLSQEIESIQDSL